MTAPVVAGLRVVPVAGHDSMLLNLSGAHGPFFTRNIVIAHRLRRPHRRRRGARRRDDPPHPRGRPRAWSTGRSVGDYHAVLARVAAARSPTATPAGAAPQTFDLRTTVHAVTAARVGPARPARASTSGCRWPHCSATGSSATAVPVLGYLFFVGDRDRPICPTLAPSADAGATTGLRVRHEEALTPEAVVRLAEAAQARYGFSDFKLKGGVLPGDAGGQGRDRAGPSGSPTRGSRSTPTAAGCCADADPAVPRAARRARLRRGPVRRRGRLLRPRGDGRVQARHRAADRDQHDRHRLARSWATRSAPAPSTSRSPTRTSGRWPARCASRSSATRGA